MMSFNHAVPPNTTLLEVSPAALAASDLGFLNLAAHQKKWLHTLAPPPRILRGRQGEIFATAFFRFRYKCLLNQRLKESPWQFEELLTWVGKGGSVCSFVYTKEQQVWAVVAQEFLEYKARQRRARSQQTPLPFAHGPWPADKTLEVKLNPSPKRIAIPSKASTCLSLLVEHPAS